MLVAHSERHVHVSMQTQPESSNGQKKLWIKMLHSGFLIGRDEIEYARCILNLSKIMTANIQGNLSVCLGVEGEDFGVRCVSRGIGNIFCSAAIVLSMCARTIAGIESKTSSHAKRGKSNSMGNCTPG